MRKKKKEMTVPAQRAFDLSNALDATDFLSLSLFLGPRINSRNIGNPLDFSNRDDLCSRFRAKLAYRERAQSFPDVFYLAARFFRIFLSLDRYSRGK